MSRASRWWFGVAAALAMPGALATPTRAEAPTPRGWSSTLACGAVLRQWNRDYACPVQANPGAPLSGRAAVAYVRANVNFGAQHYLVSAELRAFAPDGRPLGTQALGVLPEGAARRVDIAAHGFPLNARFVVAYRVTGGGTATIPAPPVIVDSYLSVRAASPLDMPSH